MEKKSARTGLRRAVSLVLALVMALSVSLLPAAAVTQQDIANLKSKAQSLNSQKAQIQSQINSLANSKSNAMQKKQLLEQKINVLRDQIAVSEQTISSLTVQIEQKEKELAEAKAEEERYFNLFCERVRSMEEDGEISYWEVMFQAKTFSQLLDQVNKVGEIMDYDNEIMDQLEAAREAVAKAKSELEQSKREEEAARNALQSQKAELDAEVGQVNSLIAQINNQSAAYANQMEDLNASASEIDQQIKQAEKAYAAQLEAQRKAEEARKQAAAAAAAQQKAQAAAAAKKAAADAAAARSAAQAANNAAASATKSNTSSSTAPVDTSNISSSGGWHWPLSGYTRIASPYGYRICPFHGRELHRGADITAPGGTPIMAARSGVVLVSTYGSSYGNYVTIAHSDGTRSLYAHMSSRAISAGSTVSAGQVIGYVGSTGSATGNHLHFEIWTNSSSSSCVNPMNYF